jgi:NADPH2:quinone reductase
VPGLEGAGVVERVGPQVDDLAPGDRVAWAGVPGSYAETVIAPTQALVAVPDGVDDEIAAAVMLQGMTAQYLCRTTWPAKASDFALVHAAAGGVGLLLIQLLKEIGTAVIGTCSTAEKEALARDAGADHVIRYTEQDFADEARSITGGRGVDVVYDSVGQSTFEGSMRSLRPRGMLVLFGQSSGKVPPFDLAGLADHGSLFITRPSLAHYNSTREELEARAAFVLDRVADGRLHVRIGARHPLAEAANAHSALEGRLTTGKVLLLP